METKPIRRRRREIENPAFFRMLKRMVEAAGARAGTGDLEDLTLLLTIRRDLDAAVEIAVAWQRASGATWEMIGQANGTTRQAALMRWGRSSS